MNLDPELWEAFCEMRKQMGKRAPFTEYAKKLILARLEQFYQDGYDPNESLRVSIERGWRGVFPQKIGEANGQQKSFDAIRREESDASTRRILERYSDKLSYPRKAFSEIPRRNGKTNLH